MPMQELKLKPGINTEATPMLNMGGWSTSGLIRFFQSFLQKLGGWTRLISTPVIGTARALVFFEDFDLNQYLGIGTDKALEVYSGGFLYNVTPIIASSNLSSPFSTVMNSPIVTIFDAANGGNAVVGSIINIVNPAAIGGLILQGPYVVQSVIDSEHYTITASSNATATVSGGGLAAEFTSSLASQNLQVTLANNGFLLGGQYTVYISTPVGGFIVSGNYGVSSIIDANNFDIQPGGAATSNATVFENSGNILIQYNLAAGNTSAMDVPGLYGAGPYGGGPYGTGEVTAITPLRLWGLGAWGTDMVASYNGGSIYAWISEDGLINNPSTLISQAPVNINAGIFIAMPQQQIVALGASDGTGEETDLMLIRWCDVGDYTDWIASATNQAGSFRLPRGSRIVGGLQGPQQGIIWTDIGMWIMQYIGFPLVYGFNELGEGCGLIGQNAKGILGSIIAWMSLNGFFIYNGSSVVPLPCPIWDIIFQNLNRGQAAKIIGAPNSFFNEMWFFYTSNTGEGEIDSYVKVCLTDGSWDYGSLIRTAWLDQTGGFQYPLGIDGSGLIQQHEFGNDADGVVMSSFAESGWMKIEEGTEYTFLERIIPDFIYQNATLQITITFANYPNGPQFVVGPLSATQATNYLIVRGRGRLVKIKISSSDLGSFWRQGSLLYSGSPAGRR